MDEIPTDAATRLALYLIVPILASIFIYSDGGWSGVFQIWEAGLALLGILRAGEWIEIQIRLIKTGK